MLKLSSLQFLAEVLNNAFLDRTNKCVFELYILPIAKNMTPKVAMLFPLGPPGFQHAIGSQWQ